MDHRSLKNFLAFCLGFFFITWLAIATAAEPETWWEIDSVNGLSGLITYMNENCLGSPGPDKAAVKAAFVACAPDEFPSGSVTYVKNGTLQFCNEDDTCRVMYDRVTSTTTYPNNAYTRGNVDSVLKCWDGADPVGGVCPEPPQCDAGQSQAMVTPHAGLDICLESCRWVSGTGVYLPAVNQGYYTYTSTGQACTTGATGSPVGTGTEYPEPPETTTTSTPHPPVTEPGPGQDETTTTSGTTTETTTTPHTKVETTDSTTIIEQINGRQVTKTTTTTTTTHADGSQTITTTTDYSATEPGKTVTNLSNGSTSTTTDQIKTGSTTTTETKDASGNTTGTSEISTGVGGEGEGGPEDEEDEPCGYFIPQFICDFFSDDTPAPEHDAMPVTEVGNEFVSWSSGLSSGTCPSSVSASFMGQSFAYDYTDACYAAETFFRPILLAIAAIVAAMIIVGARL